MDTSPLATATCRAHPLSRLTRPAACPRNCNAQIGLFGALNTPAVTTATRGQWHPHFCVPHSLTEPLAGAPPQAELEIFYYELSPHQHLSDIHRVRCLAETHPQIESVRIHKAGKEYDPSDFNVYGRAESYRQAPFDLAIELAASGALIHVGIHTNKINRKDLPQQGQLAGLIA